MVSQMFEQAIESACQSWSETTAEGTSSATWSISCLNNIIRINASLEALCSSRADAKQVTKGVLINNISSHNIADRVSEILNSQLQQVSGGNSNISAVFTAATSMVSLSNALLNHMGKKTFFHQASSVLLLCNEFVGSQISSSSRALFQGSGLEFTHEVLR